MEKGYIYILKWRTVFKIGCTNDVERRMKQNLRKKPDAKLVRAYYTIQDLTNHNTLAYLFSLTGIAEITERFDSDGKWQGII